MSSAPGGSKRVWAVIAGGGTGGHVVCGLAVAEQIATRSGRCDAVHFLGSRRGLETTAVPGAGFALTALPGRGIARSFTLSNIAAALGLCAATVVAVVRMARWRPAVGVGLGGFASVPGVVAAIVWRVPLVVVEQNAVPSVANRFGARFAKAAAVPFAGVNLPRAVQTGNPVRLEVRNVDRSMDRDAACRRLGIDPDRKVLCVVGGSLGARRINDAVFDALEHAQRRDDLAIRHITGARDYPELLRKITDLAQRDPGSPDSYRLEGGLVVQIVEFEHDMAAVYAACDLLVCRAGATTVAELTAVGVPAVLVPYPAATGDHQSANARILSEADAARVLTDGELNGERLYREVDELLSDAQLLDAMSSAAKAQGRPEAAQAVVDLLEHHARRPLERQGVT